MGLTATVEPFFPVPPDRIIWNMVYKAREQPKTVNITITNRISIKLKLGICKCTILLVKQKGKRLTIYQKIIQNGSICTEMLKKRREKNFIGVEILGLKDKDYIYCTEQKMEDVTWPLVSLKGGELRKYLL